MSTQFDPLRTTALELQPSMLEYSLEDFLRFPIKKITTYSGLDLVYFTNCSAGGEENSRKLLNLVSKTGSKKKYKHAHEWCCGHGAIGLELLHQKFCDRLSLSDKFLPAVVSAEFSVAINNWQDKVEVYLIEEFSSLPFINADLIIADPPHFSTRLAYEYASGDVPNQDGIRQVVDTDWHSHKILFSNLKNRLAEDGDLYLYETYKGSTPEIFEKMAQENGLEIVGLYDLFPNYYVAHFKYVNAI